MDLALRFNEALSIGQLDSDLDKDVVGIFRLAKDLMGFDVKKNGAKLGQFMTNAKFN